MQPTKKDHGHEHDSSKKGMGTMDEKSKKSSNDKGRSDNQKHGDTNVNREGHK